MEIKYLRVKELAHLSGESSSVWRKRIWKREIPITKFGRSVRVSMNDFENFAAARVRPASVPKGQGLAG